MKKIIPIIIALAIVLCACGNSTETKESTEASTEQASVLPDANLKQDDSAEKTETADTASGIDPETLEKARSYVGKQLTELIAEFGQPIATEYASSCLGDGEDGLITFNGFTVETYKEGDSEEIRYVD